MNEFTTVTWTDLYTTENDFDGGQIDIMGYGGEFRIIEKTTGQEIVGPTTLSVDTVSCEVDEGWLVIQVRANPGEHANVEYLCINDDDIIYPDPGFDVEQHPMPKKAPDTQDVEGIYRIKATYVLPPNAAWNPPDPTDMVWHKGKNIGFIESFEIHTSANDMTRVDVQLRLYRLEIGDGDNGVQKFIESLQIGSNPINFGLLQQYDIESEHPHQPWGISQEAAQDLQAMHGITVPVHVPAAAEHINLSVHVMPPNHQATVVSSKVCTIAIPNNHPAVSSMVTSVSSQYLHPGVYTQEIDIAQLNPNTVAPTMPASIVPAPPPPPKPKPPPKMLGTRLLDLD